MEKVACKFKTALVFRPKKLSSFWNLKFWMRGRKTRYIILIKLNLQCRELCLLKPVQIKTYVGVCKISKMIMLLRMIPKVLKSLVDFLTISQSFHLTRHKVYGIYLTCTELVWLKVRTNFENVSLDSLYLSSRLR